VATFTSRQLPHAAVRIEALDGLHEADVALLDQVGMGQAVAEVAARKGDHEAQMREHQRPGGVQVLVLPETPGERALLFGAQDWKAVDGLDVSLEAPRRHRHRKRTGQGQRCLHGR
jgi:hypothetical protein